jgi:catalase
VACNHPSTEHTKFRSTAGPRGPHLFQLLQDVWLEEAGPLRPRGDPRAAHARQGFRRVRHLYRHQGHHEIHPGEIFSKVGKKTEMFARFSTVAGERGAADAERDIRGFAMKFYTEEGNWDLVGNNTPVFFMRDPLKFPDLNQAVKRDPRTNLRSAATTGTSGRLPEALHQSHHRDERPRHARRLPPHARLRLAHL